MGLFDWLRPPTDKANELHEAVGRASGEIMSHSDGSFSVSVRGGKPQRFHRTGQGYDQAIAFARENKKR